MSFMLQSRLHFRNKKKKKSFIYKQVLVSSKDSEFKPHSIQVLNPIELKEKKN